MVSCVFCYFSIVLFRHVSLVNCNIWYLSTLLRASCTFQTLRRCTGSRLRVNASPIGCGRWFDDLIISFPTMAVVSLLFTGFYSGFDGGGAYTKVSESRLRGILALKYIVNNLQPSTVVSTSRSIHGGGGGDYNCNSTRFRSYGSMKAFAIPSITSVDDV